MADIQLPQSSTLDADVLAAARARKNTQYAKDALARARVALRQEPDLSSHVNSVIPAVVDNSASIVPPFPHLPGFDGQPTDEVIDIQDWDAYMGLVVESLDQAAASQEGPGRGTAGKGEGDEAEQKEFESIERWFKKLKDPTMAQQVKYATAKRNHEIRNKRSESQWHLERQEAEEEAENAEAAKSDNGIFVPENDGEEETSTGGNTQAKTASTRPARKRKTQNRLTAEEKRKSMSVGFEPILRKAQGKGGRNKRAAKPKGKGAAAKTETGPGDKKGKKRKNPATNDEPSVLSSLQTNVFQEAHASAAAPALMPFTASKRMEAVAQLIACIPTVEQDQAKNDGERLLKALKKFNHRVASDGQGGWRMTGLKTSMFNYQVLGCAFMRDRENSPDEPQGGIVADVMGIGKTLEALVNILDGEPSDPDDPVKTTLLVVPSHLTKHWMDQIRLHCEEEALGRVVHYHAGAKLMTLNDKNDLQRYQIVITTYDEVRRSYPVFKPAKQLADERQLREQWENQYEKGCGPLHRIKFQRIVLDEAHIIKNKDSSVSLAVRGLAGRYKWILSGTPVHKCHSANEEFYPLLCFLGVPGIENKGYEHFAARYCSDDDAKQRLSNLLRAFMLRRTHSSRLFSLPIIKLPDIEERSIDVEFSEAEWLMYETIERYFVDSINELADESNFKTRQCRECHTLFLKLRMFCSHPLTVQLLLKDLLRKGLMRDLNQLAKTGCADPNDPSPEIIGHIRLLQNEFKRLVQQRREQEKERGEEQPEEHPIFGDNPDILNKFSGIMHQLYENEEWVEILDRDICGECGRVPDKRVISSCMHQYCEECFSQLLIDTERYGDENPDTANGEQAKKPVCLKCANPIESATRCFVEEMKEPEKRETPAEKKARRQAKTRGSGKERPKKKGKSEEAEKVEDQNWMEVDTTMMPAAKVRGIKDKVEEWKRENPATKVVIFSQFTDMIQILANMCEKENWGYRRLTGKVQIGMRHKYLEEFKTEKAITILIVSLHCGGVGLDMTVAHKCILVDLWWNEAVQNQAFCRLLRCGQTQNVECVKMVVKGSIDDYMLRLQSKKTVEITSSMGDDVLSKRDSVIELLKLFADVEENEEGQLHLKPKKRVRRGTKFKEAVENGMARRRASDKD